MNRFSYAVLTTQFYIQILAFSLDFVCSDFRLSIVSRTTFVLSWDRTASLIGTVREMFSSLSRFGAGEINAMSLSASAMRWVPGRPLAPPAAGGPVMRWALVAPVLSDRLDFFSWDPSIAGVRDVDSLAVLILIEYSMLLEYRRFRLNDLFERSQA